MKTLKIFKQFYIPKSRLISPVPVMTRAGLTTPFCREYTHEARLWSHTRLLGHVRTRAMPAASHCMNCWLFVSTGKYICPAFIACTVQGFARPIDPNQVICGATCCGVIECLHIIIVIIVSRMSIYIYCHKINCVVSC